MVYRDDSDPNSGACMLQTYLNEDDNLNLTFLVFFSIFTMDIYLTYFKYVAMHV